MNFYQFADCRHGRFLYNRNDTYVGRSLAIYGEWSEAEIRLFRQIVRPGDTVVEAGANLGAHTVFLSSAAGEHGQVVAFEPARLTHQLLCANVALNECFNVRTINKAVGRSRGMTRFPKLDPRAPGNFGGASMRFIEQDGFDATEEVEMQSIDDLHLDRIDFLKSDVEGFEPELLRGAEHALHTLRPIVYLEIDVANGQPTGNRDELVGLLDAAGYAAYYYFAPIFLPDNLRQNSEDIFKAHSLDMLCVPQEKARVEGLTRAAVADNALRVDLQANSLVSCVAPWHEARFGYL